MQICNVYVVDSVKLRLDALIKDLLCLQSFAINSMLLTTPNIKY